MRYWLAAPTLLLLLAGATLRAQEPAHEDASAPEENKPAGRRWSGSVGLSFTGFAGNRESGALSGSIRFTRTAGRTVWDFDADAHVLRIEEESNETARSRSEDHEIDSSLRRSIGERWYAIGKVKWEHKPQNGIDSELQGGPGLGFHVARGEKLAFRVEGGLSGTEEAQLTDTLHYSSVFLDATLTRTLANGAQLTWISNLKIGSESGGDVKSDQELEVEAPLTRRLSLGLKGEWEHDSDPQEGFERNDYKLVAKLVIKLWQ